MIIKNIYKSEIQVLSAKEIIILMELICLANEQEKSDVEIDVLADEQLELFLAYDDLNVIGFACLEHYLEGTPHAYPLLIGVFTDNYSGYNYIEVENSLIKAILNKYPNMHYQVTIGYVVDAVERYLETNKKI